MKRILIITLAVMLGGCGIVRQHKYNEAATEAKQAAKDCMQQRLDGELKTHVDVAKCTNERFTDAFEKVNYPRMDLIELGNAKRLEIAERVDHHKITEAQGKLEFAEFKEKMFANERANEMAASQQQAQRDQLILQTLSNMQQNAQPAHDPNRIMCSNNPMASGTMPNPTICQSY